MLVDFHHNVLVEAKGDELGTVYFRTGGGIGDYLVFLVAVRPLLSQYAGWRRILAVDDYLGYGDHHPIEDICRATGLIEEVWIDKDGADHHHLPSAAFDEAPGLSAELWKRYACSDDPLGVRIIPFNAMLGAVARGEVSRRLTEPETRNSMVKQYPFMVDSYITVHPYSSAKGVEWSFPVESVHELAAVMGCPVVVLRFPSSPDSYYQLLEDISGVCVVGVEDMCRGISIQAHARCHIGVESSQLIVAALYDVPALFLHYPGGADGENPWLRMLGVRDSCQRAETVDGLVLMAADMARGEVTDEVLEIAGQRSWPVWLNAYLLACRGVPRHLGGRVPELKLSTGGE